MIKLTNLLSDIDQVTALDLHLKTSKKPNDKIRPFQSNSSPMTTDTIGIISLSHD